MSTPQEVIQSLIDAAVAEGRERGIRVAAYHHGKLVVDAWAGTADADRGTPVDQETLFPVFSVIKGFVSTLIHLLAERGKLRYDDRIADHWPEFAAQGKEDIRIRHALNHTAGLQFMPHGLTHHELCDWESMCDFIAKMKPASAPGRSQTYHAVTFGWILGELARRVDGRALPQMLREEICRPLGVDDIFCGIPDEVEPRIAILEHPDAPEAPPADDAAPREVPVLMLPLHAWLNRADARRACIPASNGIMSSRSLARFYAALLPGGVDGVELLPPERIRLATHYEAPPAHAGPGPARPLALGYFVGGETDSLIGNNPCAFGHGGFGGSVGFADPEHQLAVGLTKNMFSSRGAQLEIVRRLRTALNAGL